MRYVIVSLCLATAPVHAFAQEEDAPSLMEQGLDLFFEGFRQELAPSLEDLQEFAEEMEPALRSFIEEMGPTLRGLMADVQDWSAYHPPEILPNGDIILRKKRPEEREETPVDPDLPEEIEI